MNKDQTILITGADGFVGTRLIHQLLNTGYTKIICHTRAVKDYGNPRIVNTYGDLRNISSIEEWIKDVDCVIHLAGKISYQTADKYDLLRDNHILTRDLVNSCINANVKKLIFLSSASTLTRTSNPFLISEAAQGRAIFHSNYAKSKYLAELEIHRGQAEGLNCTILNPCLILGEGDWSRSSLGLLKRISGGLKYYPSGNLGIVDVNFVIQNIMQSIENQLDIGPHLLFQSAYSYKDFINLVCNQLKISSPIRVLPYSKARVFSIFEFFRNIFKGSKNIITQETAFLSSNTFTYSVRNLIPNLPKNDFDLESLVQRSIKSNI